MGEEGRVSKGGSGKRRVGEGRERGIREEEER
jgi:hypothetical protein